MTYPFFILVKIHDQNMKLGGRVFTTKLVDGLLLLLAGGAPGGIYINQYNLIGILKFRKTCLCKWFFG